MSIRFNLLLFLIFCLAIKASAQSTAINNNIFSQPPQVASLMKFTETPVSYYNGTANISVPLYDIHCGNLEFPISINYNTSGIKVSEESGIVGLGWNISTNAAVVDPIGNNNNPFKPDVVPATLNWTPSQAPLTGLTNLIMQGEVFKTSQGVCTDFPQFQFQGGLANYDPDMRILNVNGISAKFMHPNGSPAYSWLCVDGQNIQLIQNPDNTYTAITPDGTKYNFNNYIQASTFANQSYTSTTYLTSIVSTTGKTITFKYISPPSSLQPVIITRVQSWVRDNILSQPGALNDAFNWSTLSEQFLSEIDFDNGKVLFNYGSRTDLASYALNSITVWRTSDTAPFKTINFEYSYFSYPMGNYGDYTTDLQTVSGLVPSVTAMLATQPYRQQRLKLLSVRINNDAPYSFTYDNTPMPFKTSWAQDLWGYFNGNTTKSLLPNYNYLPYAGTQVPLTMITDAQNGAALFSNRAANFNFMKAGVLTGITYPTGGYSAFQYQPNTFSYNQGRNNITDTLMVAEAIGGGAKVQEFDIPDLGLLDANFNDVVPTQITARLFCGSTGSGVCNYANNSGPNGCSGYNYSTGVQPLDAANADGLWAMIQVQNNGTWQTPANFTNFGSWSDNIFDRQNTNISPTSCTISNMTKNLPPGHYRIIANYPTSLTNGVLGGPYAHIQISYKTWASGVPNNTGPGLRISTITDYAAGGKVALKKNITYSGGQLMTQPIFYRFLNNETHVSMLEPLCVQNGTPWGAYAICLDPNGLGLCGCFNPVIIPRTTSIVYSDPVIPYSYSANGSLFGYSTVYEQRVDGNGADQGRTMYNFNCQPDNYTFYGWNLPGTPPVASLTNSKLVEVQQQKNVGGQYQTIHTTHYDYTIGTPATYWGFKVEYRPNYVNCVSITAGDPIITWSVHGSTLYIYVDTPPVINAGIGAQDNSDPSSGGYTPLNGNQFLHFYPIPTGHVNLLDKIEYSYDSSTPHIVTTNYTYNALNQQRAATTVESDGKTYASQTYYPADYTTVASTDFTSQMLGKHMLEYPIESISTVNGLAVSAGYTSFSLHDNMITPLGGSTLNSLTPVAVTASTPANTPDSHYEPRVNFTYDANGNMTKQQKVNGPMLNYLWDYSNDLPTAAITNATANDFAYTSFETTAKGNFTYSGAPVLDGTSPSGQYVYNLATGTITASNLLTAKTYSLSYWTKASSPFTVAGTISGYPLNVRTLNGWTNYLYKITGVAGVTITGNGLIDDIHLFPSDAQMSTYVYDPLIGMTAATDTKGNTVYYEYDNNERLRDVKDLKGNFVKAYTYSFAGWPGGNALGNFSSAATSQTFSKSDCSVGYSGGAVLYSVPAGAYGSFISQADADAKAQDDLNRNGPIVANQLGGCTVAPCAPGAITSASGQSLNYTITYGSSVILNGVVLLVITNSSGTIITEKTLTTSAGTVSGTVPTSGIYGFTIQVQGEYCTTPVKSQTQTLSL